MYQSPSSFRIRYATLALVALTLLLVISIFVPTLPAPFFFFVILNAILQAAATAYFTATIFALAAIFGPLIVQSVALGQGIVGIVLGIVQLVSVAVSIDKVIDPAPASSQSLRTGVEKSAAGFFLFVGIFLVLCLFAHAWLVRLTPYQLIVIPFEAGKLTKIVEREGGEGREGREPLMGRALDSFNEPESVASRVDILSVTKMNWTYNAAVAYTFAVTFVSFRPPVP